MGTNLLKGTPLPPCPLPHTPTPTFQTPRLLTSVHSTSLLPPYTHTSLPLQVSQPAGPSPSSSCRISIHLSKPSINIASLISVVFEVRVLIPVLGLVSWHHQSQCILSSSLFPQYLIYISTHYISILLIIVASCPWAHFSS